MFEQRLILDRYRIIGKAGAGGYATVQHAYDTRLKRDVAIKCIELTQTDLAKARVSVVDGLIPGYQESILDQVFYEEDQDYVEDLELPDDPDFLNMRDEMAKKRNSRSRARQRRGDRGARTAQAGRKGSSSRRSRLSAKGELGTATSDIASLAGELPVISGAGLADIASIDDAVDVSDVYTADDTYAYDDYDAYDDGDYADDSDYPTHTVPLIGAARAKQYKQTRAQIKNQRSARKRPSVDSLQLLQQAISPLESTLDNIPGLEEARTAAHLNDANIVTVYDCVVEGNMVYVIMEFVEGKTLARMMRELDNSITLDMVTCVFVSVAHALEVAHKAGVLHLDIKPENVIVNKDGVVKVADFGLSSLMDISGHGTTGGGTIGYMPLEQMRQFPLDVRTDEWALASLTYEMLSGVNPYRAKDLAGAEVAIEEARLLPPSHFWDIDPKIDDVMMRALSPDMDERYPTLNDFADSLSPFLADSKAGKKQLANIVVEGTTRERNSIFINPDEEDASAYGANGRPGLFNRLLGRSKKSAKDESDDSHDEDFERVPIIDRLGERGRSIIMRIFAALSACMVSTIAMLNFRFELGGSSNESADGGFTDAQSASDTTNVDGLDIGEAVSASDLGNLDLTSAYSTAYGDGSLYGLFSLVPPLAWVLLVGFTVLAFIKPKFGMPAAYGAFFITLLLNQAWGSAFLLLAATGAWWWFFGRHSNEACTIVMLQPLFGSIGFAALVPVLAGALLDLRDACAATVMACVGAIIFASLGSEDVLNWAIYSNFIVAINPVIAGASIMQGLSATLTNLDTWCILVSWILGASLFSLLCWRGTKSFDILGSIVCGALIILGAFLVPLLFGGENIFAEGIMLGGISEEFPMEPLRIAGVVIPAIIGIIISVNNVPDRVRTDY